MIRIDIHYGGQRYRIGHRDLDEVRAEIDRAVEAGHGWIEVEESDGAPRNAFLLVSAGVPLVIVPLSGDESSSPSSEDDISDMLVTG